MNILFRRVKFLRWTGFLLLLPCVYVEATEEWRDFPFIAWSEEEYTWEEDGWDGLKDYASLPETTAFTCKGDCEDYALLAASWLRSRGEEVSLCFMWNWSGEMHMVAYSSGTVFSSGDIVDTGIDEFVEQSKYNYCCTRKVRC